MKTVSMYLGRNHQKYGSGQDIHKYVSVLDGMDKCLYLFDWH